MNTRHYLSLSIVVAAQLLGSVASADPKRPDDGLRVVVSFAELDLSKPAGADALYKRIRSAAKTVCSTHGSVDLALISQSRACFRSAVDNAVAQVNHPRLSALHDHTVGNQSEVLTSAKR